MTNVSETNLDRRKLAKGMAFHRTLNPKLWRKEDMDVEVRVALLRAALAFYEFLGVPGLKIEDVIFTGSNAAYNYTPFSDLDVHLVVDFAHAGCPDLVENLFTTKKTLWNRMHAVTIHGYSLEMYIEDTASPVTAQGVYSLLRGEWVHHPSPAAPKRNDAVVAAKVESLADQIDEVLESEPNREDIDALVEKIYRMRKAGLAKAGEFSVENLAFKGLRNLGYIDRIWNAREEADDRQLSLEAET
jgi:hypothetical protein